MTKEKILPDSCIPVNAESEETNKSPSWDCYPDHLRPSEPPDTERTPLQDSCPCGGIILADTEDWKIPRCYECWEKMGCPEEEPPEEVGVMVANLKGVKSTGVTTGRFSSSGPNAQSIPRSSVDWGKEPGRSLRVETDINCKIGEPRMRVFEPPENPPRTDPDCPECAYEKETGQGAPVPHHCDQMAVDAGYYPEEKPDDPRKCRSCGRAGAHVREVRAGRMFIVCKCGEDLEEL